MSKQIHDNRGHSIGQPVQLAPDSQYQQRCLSRVNEYVQFCQSEYNVNPAAALVIASTLIPCYPHRPIWLVIESQRHPFWSHLSYALNQLHFPSIIDCQTMRSAPHMDPMYWLSDREHQPRIFVDSDAEERSVWHGVHRRHAYWTICHECIRIQTPAHMKKLPDENAADELARLLRLVIDPTHRRVLAKPVDIPESIPKLGRLLAKINAEMKPDSRFYQNIALLPVAHAALYGRPVHTVKDLQYDDMLTVKSVMCGSVKQWMRHMMHYYFTSVLPLEFHGAPRVGALPNLRAVVELIWPSTSRSWAFTELNLLLKGGVLRRYKVLSRRHLVNRPIYSHGIRYEVTKFGEYLANMLFDPDWDVEHDLFNITKPALLDEPTPLMKKDRLTAQVINEDLLKERNRI